MTQDLHHLAAAYALDALTDDERRDFEAHYPTCAICAADVVAHRSVAGRLAEPTAVDPPPAMRDAVMARIADTRQMSPITETAEPIDELAARRRRRIAASIAAVAAVFVLLAGLVVLQPDPDPYADVIAAPDAVVTSLEGDGGSIQVVWSAERGQVAVLASDVAEVDDDLAYQLWFLLDEGVAPAGLFVPDDDGVVRTVLDVDDLDAGGWGITVEPATGSEQPTSDVIYVGTF